MSNAVIVARSSTPYSTDPLPASKVNAGNLDNDVNRIDDNVDALHEALEAITRDDNQLRDGIVRYFSLSPDVLTAFNLQNNWNLKVEVRAAATANVNVLHPVSASFDGITASAGDRVLLVYQTAQAENWIWIFNGVGVAMTRATDSNSAGLVESAYTVVREGSTLSFTGWQVTNDDIVSLGTDAIVVARVSSGGGGGGSTSSVVATGSKTSRTLADRFAGELNIKDFGAIGDDGLHPMSTATANEYNTQFGGIGLAVVAGDQQDYAAIQAAILTAGVTGKRVHIPAGTYKVNKSVGAKWSASPLTGQMQNPIIACIYGDGNVSSVIEGIAIGAGRGVMELLGESNPISVNCEVRDLTLRAVAGSSVDSWCLRVGDAWCGIRGVRLNLEGAHCLLLKVASSATYAQLCSQFDQVKCISNYNHVFYADDKLAPLFALGVETGGARWDNVTFRSCVFSGHCEVRGEIVEFQNCQFSTNPERPTVDGIAFNDNVFIRIGHCSFHHCYFEDHNIAIAASPFYSDIMGIEVINCRFSGVTNYAGAPLPTYGIKVNPNDVTGYLGPVIIEGCMFKSSGYTVMCISLTGVVGRVGPNGNVEDLRTAITTEYFDSNIEEVNQLWNMTDPFPVATHRSTFPVNEVKKLSASSIEDDAISTPGSVLAGNKVRGIELSSYRQGTGIGNGESWGVAIGNAGDTDAASLLWSSTTYTTGGTIPWFTNDNLHLYIPTTKSLRIGYGVSATDYTDFDSSGITGATQNCRFNAFLSIQNGTGVGNGESWGFSIQNAGNTDTYSLAWASTTYTTGGALPWVPNDSLYEYIPTARVKRLGYGTSLNYYEWSESMATMAGGLQGNARNDVALVGNVPMTIKITVTRAQLAAAALVAAITIMTLPAKVKILAVTLKHSALFGGGAIATYTVEVGSVALSTKYAPAFNVHQATGNAVFQDSNLPGMEDFAATAAIQMTARSTGANLNAATTGSVDVFITLVKYP